VKADYEDKHGPIKKERKKKAEKAEKGEKKASATKKVSKK
jgi:hypothetical protein